MVIRHALTFDPGVRARTLNMGWALSFNREIFAAGLLDKKAWPQIGVFVAEDEILKVERVFVEMPRWYPNERSIDVNDLIDLAAAVGWVERQYENRVPVERVYPREWKGTVPKEVMLRRIFAALTEEEKLRVPRRVRADKKNTSVTAHDPNVIEAIGINLRKLGRLHGATNL